MENLINTIKLEINKLQGEKESVIIAIDGRCAAGKTTLASKLKEALKAEVFHMDDFFLRPEQRTMERLSIPGENVDHERFEKEVLLPIKRGQNFSYRPYSCRVQQLLEEVHVSLGAIHIIEGSYSCHPALTPYYDLKIFLDIDPATQIERIIKRNGESAAKVFRDKWIPLEEQYFAKCHVRESADMYFQI